jgi:hypothetical protein
MTIPPSLMAGAKIVGAVLAILSGWFTIEARLDATLHDYTATIIEAHISDLRTRVILQDLEIRETTDAGKDVPDYMHLNKQLIEKQLQELKEWGE